LGAGEQGKRVAPKLGKPKNVEKGGCGWRGKLAEMGQS